MKRLMVLCLMLAAVATSYAKGVMVVDSEQVFKSLDQYNAAIAEVDSLSSAYQAQVDDKFAKVEEAFNKYSAERVALNATQRADREKLILIQEKLATNFQQEHFSKDGTIMQRRVELIAPIQELVFGTIDSYAEQEGYDVVIDKSGNASLLYIGAGVDKTDEIIEKLK